MFIVIWNVHDAATEACETAESAKQDAVEQYGYDSWEEASKYMKLYELKEVIE